MKALRKVIFIVGPTAVGKTDIAFSLAKRIKGEIISCDSMQVYKEITIASNKPPVSFFQEVPHHLIDIVSVEENFDVSLFNDLACSVIKDIHQRNKVPIIAGGSGLYMQVLIDGIFTSGQRDEALRSGLFEQAARYGNLHLHAMLQEKDPAGAQRIHPNDLKKVIRALEVCINEGKPISELQKQRQGIWGQYAVNIYCMDRDRKELYRIIEQRVEAMFEAGIVAEIAGIQARALSQGAKSIIGVKEILGYLKGDYDVETAKALMKMHTRRLAKRQLTWFRKDKRIKWFNLEENTRAEIVARIKEENTL